MAGKKISTSSQRKAIKKQNKKYYEKYKNKTRLCPFCERQIKHHNWKKHRKTHLEIRRLQCRHVTLSGEECGYSCDKKVAMRGHIQACHFKYAARDKWVDIPEEDQKEIDKYWFEANTRADVNKALENLKPTTTTKTNAATAVKVEHHLKNLTEHYCPLFTDVVEGRFDFEEASLLDKQFRDHYSKNVPAVNTRGNPDPYHSENYIFSDPRNLVGIIDALKSALIKGNKKEIQKHFGRFVIAVWYAGKGVPGRWGEHEQSSKHGQNKIKDAMLREIRETGQLHLVTSLFSGASDEEATAREWILINTLGLPNLTNMSAGNLPPNIHKLFSNENQLDLDKVAKLGVFLIFFAYESFLRIRREYRPLPQSEIVAEEEMEIAEEKVKSGSETETEDENTDSEGDDSDANLLPRPEEAREMQINKVKTLQKQVQELSTDTEIKDIKKGGTITSYFTKRF